VKKSRFTEEQIAFALKQAETGTPVSAAARSRSGADARQVWLLPNLHSALAGGLAGESQARLTAVS
jgi:putative transposase